MSSRVALKKKLQQIIGLSENKKLYYRPKSACITDKKNISASMRAVEYLSFSVFSDRTSVSLTSHTLTFMCIVTKTWMLVYYKVSVLCMPGRFINLHTSVQQRWSIYGGM